MKIPEQNGYYRYYDGEDDKNKVVKFESGKIYFTGWEVPCYPDNEYDAYGSYFIDPIEPITFD